jgi:hypothetical protein
MLGSVQTLRPDLLIGVPRRCLSFNERRVQAWADSRRVGVAVGRYRPADGVVAAAIGCLLNCAK